MPQIVVNADPVQSRLCDGVEWKRDLTMDQYLEREAMLEHFLPCTYLQYREGDTVLSACRYNSRRAVAVDSSGLFEIKEASIANVFTTKKFRGKGYAAKVVSRATELALKDNSLVTLWSDVGTYYSRFGFKPLEANSQIVIVEDLPWPDNVDAIGKDSRHEYITKHQDEIKTSLRKVYEETQVPCAAVLPTDNIYDVWWTSSEYTAKVTNARLGSAWGAKTGDSWCLWTYHTPSNTMLMLGMGGSPEDSEKLITAAVAAAHQAGLSKLEIFEGCSGYPFQELPSLNAKVVQRNGSLPMYISKYVWKFPGKYAWF